MCVCVFRDDMMAMRLCCFIVVAHVGYFVVWFGVVMLYICFVVVMPCTIYGGVIVILCIVLR